MSQNSEKSYYNMSQNSNIIYRSFIKDVFTSIFKVEPTILLELNL